MGKILDVFGKETGIRLSDLHQKLVEPALEESVTVEYKVASQQAFDNKKRDDFIEDAILSPTIGFLNKTERESCLLALGIAAKDGVPTDVEPVPGAVLDAEKINAHIRGSVGCAPRSQTPVAYRVVEVKCAAKGSVFLIELNRWEPSGYFSRISNKGYVRKGDATVELSTPELLDLVDRNRTSGSALNVRSVEIATNPTAPGVTYSIKCHCENFGSRPGRDVSGFIEFIVRGPGAVTVTAPTAEGFTDVSGLNQGRRLYQFYVQQNLHWPLYPGSNADMGEFKVHLDKEATFEVLTTTNDADGVTNWKFRITAKGRLRTLQYDRRRWG